MIGIGSLTLLPPPWPEAPRAPDPEVALVRPLLRWMRDHTPAPPEPSGVVADYLLGHFVTLWAERPAVATTFSQSPTHVAGNARASAVLAAPDDATGWERMQETGGRFLLVAPLPVLGVDPEASRNGLGAWLHRTAGMEGAEREASAHFRLWRDAPERPGDGALYARLFEAVPGARLTGRAPPGTEIVARLRLTTNLGEPLEYVRRATADADGHFELRVAYATDAVHPVFAHKGAYEVIAGDRKVAVRVPEQALAGGTVVLPD